MKKTLLVTFEIEVTDLPEAELKAEAKLVGCDVEDFTTLEDADSLEVAECMTSVLEESDDMFAGSGLYIQVTTGKVVQATWK
jgi:hypothetical protein